MTFRSKSILPDGFRSKPIINKVLDNVFGDFKGPIGRKTYSLLCNEIVSSYYFFFFLLDFSKMPGRIFMKFSGMVYLGLERPKIIFRVMTSLPVRDIDDFLILRVSFCDAISTETTQDIFFKFSRMIDKGLKSINC